MEFLPFKSGLPCSFRAKFFASKFLLERMTRRSLFSRSFLSLSSRCSRGGSDQILVLDLVPLCLVFLEIQAFVFLHFRYCWPGPMQFFGNEVGSDASGLLEFFLCL